jgi:hypothetical protein
VPLDGIKRGISYSPQKMDEYDSRRVTGAISLVSGG